MSDIRMLHLKILQGRLAEIAHELTGIRFRARTAHPAWQPHINVYRTSGHIVICAELAGMERSEIDLRVDAHRVVLSGRRVPPTPASDSHGQLMQIHVLEIDDGAVEREIPLPDEVVPDAARVELRNGLLWVDLPLRPPDVQALEPPPYSS